MPFSDMLNNNVMLLKASGEKVENIKASVQASKIFIQRSDILIESGDVIYHRMSNGAEETFEVLDPGFHEAFHGIPAGYQMLVKKMGMAGR